MLHFNFLILKCGINVWQPNDMSCYVFLKTVDTTRTCLETCHKQIPQQLIKLKFHQVRVHRCNCKKMTIAYYFFF